MKKLNLSIEEFYIFKAIAKFLYDFSYSKGEVIISADAHMLEQLGY